MHLVPVIVNHAKQNEWITEYIALQILAGVMKDSCVPYVPNSIWKNERHLVFPKIITIY